MDIICVAWVVGDTGVALLVKVLCTSAILTPLVIYSLLNGPKALWCVKWRVVAVAVIVACHLNFYLSGKP
jgi:hypothetical protein